MKLPFKVTVLPLNDDGPGDVFADDGEFLGTWWVDDYEMYHFAPDGTKQPLFVVPTFYHLTRTLTDWYEARVD